MEEPANLDAWRAAYDIAADLCDGAQAARCALKVVALYASLGERKLAATLISDALGRVGGELPIDFYFAAAGQAERAGDIETALLAYRRLTSDHPADPAAAMAYFKTGQVLRRLDAAADACWAFEQVTAHPACTQELREAAGRALVGLNAGTRV